MKNKILLGSVTLLSALMVAACGNGEKKTAETAAAPTTEVTTVAPTTTAPTTTASTSSTEKKYHLKILNVLAVKNLVILTFLRTGSHTKIKTLVLNSSFLHQINTMCYQ